MATLQYFRMTAQRRDVLIQLRDGAEWQSRNQLAQAIHWNRGWLFQALEDFVVLSIVDARGGPRWCNRKHDEYKITSRGRAMLDATTKIGDRLRSSDFC